MPQHYRYHYHSQSKYFPSSDPHNSHCSLCFEVCSLFLLTRYAPGTNCSYLLRGSSTQKVRLHFEKMKMTKKTPITDDAGSECSEYLALYDASWPDPAKVMKVFCSSFSPPLENQDFVSTGAALLVTFISRSGRYSCKISFPSANKIIFTFFDWN